MNKTSNAVKPLKSPRQYRAIRLLLEGNCTVRYLLEHAGGNGIPQLISTLRRRNLQIKRITLDGKDRDGRKVRFCEYELQPESFELAKHLLTMEDC